MSIVDMFKKQLTLQVNVPANRKRYSHRQQNAIKAPQWYAVQVSDTTMLTIAAALPGQ